MRYTEYHDGVAVIKDKVLLKEAMEKLAKYEDKEDKRKAINASAVESGVCQRECDICAWNRRVEE